MTKIKNFILIFTAFIITDLISLFFWNFGNNQLNAILLILVFCGIVILGIKKPSWLLYLAAGELLVGAQGRLLTTETPQISISLRIVMFCAIMLVWLGYFIKNKKTAITKSKLYYTSLVFIAVVFIGLINALLRQHSIADIYHDFNNWIYLFYLLPLLDFWDKKHSKQIFIDIFITATTFVALKTLIIYSLFSNAWLDVSSLYKWLRDTRFSEITFVTGNLYRVFSSAQVFLVFGVMAGAGWLLFKEKLNKSESYFTLAYITITLAATIISLSRSNWIGLLTGGLVLFGYGIFRIRKTKPILLFVGKIVGASILAVILIYLLAPNALSLANANNTLRNRLEITEAAASSRASQFPVLVKEIIKHPLIGTVWGSTATYISRDPRILNNHPDGVYTTYAFELSYLDILLKIGLAGLLIYFYWIYSIKKTLLTHLKKNPVLSITLCSSIIALLIINIFSPYLNHPLGFGLLLFTFVISENS